MFVSVFSYLLARNLIFAATLLFEKILQFRRKIYPSPFLKARVYYHMAGATKGHMTQVTLTLTLDIAVWPIFSHKSLNIASNKSYKLK